MAALQEAFNEEHQALHAVKVQRCEGCGAGAAPGTVLLFQLGGETLCERCARKAAHSHAVPDPGPVITNLFAPIPDGPPDPVVDAEARRRYVEELQSMQSKAADQLTRRVLTAIESVEPRKDQSLTGAMAAAAVEVFVEFLRTPPTLQYKPMDI